MPTGPIAPTKPGSAGASTGGKAGMVQPGLSIAGILIMTIPREVRVSGANTDRLPEISTTDPSPGGAVGVRMGGSAGSGKTTPSVRGKSPLVPSVSRGAWKGPAPISWSARILKLPKFCTLVVAFPSPSRPSSSAISCVVNGGSNGSTGMANVSSTKGLTGHAALGAACAHEAIDTLLMFQHGSVAPTANLAHVASECEGLRYVDTWCEPELHPLKHHPHSRNAGTRLGLLRWGPSQ